MERTLDSSNYGLERLYWKNALFALVAIIFLFSLTRFLFFSLNDYFGLPHSLGRGINYTIETFLYQVLTMLSVFIPLWVFNVANCRHLLSLQHLGGLERSSVYMAVVVISLYFMLLVLAVMIFGEGASDLGYQGQKRLIDAFSIILLATILAPILEETLFRQILPSILEVNFKCNIFVSIVVCSLLFSVAHFLPRFYDEFTLLKFSHYFLLGMCFHVIRIISGSLLLAIIAHGLFNVLVTILYIFL